jgi:hypothetical protein
VHAALAAVPVLVAEFAIFYLWWVVASANTARAVVKNRP